MTRLEDVLRADEEGPVLSFAAHDPERRLAFPAGRFTAPALALPLVGAALLSVASYAALTQLAPEAWITQSLTLRGPIPYGIVFCAWWGAAVLAVKARKLALQRRALALRLLPADDPAFALTPETADRVLGELYRRVDEPQRFLLTRRIQHALSNLRNMRRIGDVDGVLRTQADHDEAQVDASYTLVRGILWLLPVLGFIGTVLGLSLALGSFGGVLEQAGDLSEVRAALRSVTAGLATAFETTLQGLVATVVLHLAMIFVRGREELFLEDCKDYCQRCVVARLRLDDPAAGEAAA